MPAQNKIAFEIVGFERPEIVAQLRTICGKQGASIASLSHNALSAPMTGDRLFSATVVVQLPANLSKRNLQHAIEDISPDITVHAAAA